MQLFRVFQQMVDDGLGHVLAEHAPDVELLAAFGGVAEGRGQGEAQAQGDPGQHRIGPPAEMEGPDDQPQVSQGQGREPGQGGGQPGEKQDHQHHGGGER